MPGFPNFDTGMSYYRNPYDPAQQDIDGVPMPKVPDVGGPPAASIPAVGDRGLASTLTADTATGAAGGAATGAAMGAAGGPPGVVIGAGIGALTSLMNGLFSAGAQREQQVRAAKVDAEKQRYQSQMDSVNRGVQNSQNAFASMMDAYRGALR